MNDSECNLEFYLIDVLVWFVLVYQLNHGCISWLICSLCLIPVVLLYHNSHKPLCSLTQGACFFFLWFFTNTHLLPLYFVRYIIITYIPLGVCDIKCNTEVRRGCKWSYWFEKCHMHACMHTYGSVLVFFYVICFGEPAGWSNSRLKRRVQGYLFNLLVMYSHYSWESMGFLVSLILTLLTITVTPSLFLSIYPPASLFPPLSKLPWRFIVALTERPLPSPPVNAGWNVYHGSAAPLGPVCVHACISSLDVYETENLPRFSPLLSFRWASWKSGIWALQNTSVSGPISM